jgi:hypothetical protein
MIGNCSGCGADLDRNQDHDVGCQQRAGVEVFETVTTHDLREGDMVYCHGTLFELTGVYAGSVGVSRTDRDADDVVGFHTKVVRVDYPEGMPAQWRDGWDIQGNKRARWARRVQS